MPVLAALAVDSQSEGSTEAEPEAADGDWSALEASAAASDADGQVEIVAMSPPGIDRWAPDAMGNWLGDSVASGVAAGTAAGPLAIQDVDGDGQLDLFSRAGRVGRRSV